ncbi:MAG: sel1 repeat family protein [Kofleriaceae bacterium]|nr:sel1 repeat family protein [Kofleriaceae bacterium]
MSGLLLLTASCHKPTHVAATQSNGMPPTLPAAGSTEPAAAALAQAKLARDQKTCAAGDMQGCFDLGVAYQDGGGVPQDAAKAASLF